MIKDYNQNNNISSTQSINNTSGQGSGAVVPKEIKGWSWGAFFWSWVWGLFHHVWLSLLVFIPYGGLVMAIILGIKGNEWAWQAQHYGSVEEFKKRERKWAIAGFIMFISTILISTIIILVY